MNYIVQDKDDLIRLFVKAGWNKSYACQIINDFFRMLKAKGPEWTCKRITTIRTWYLQHLGGNTHYRPDTSKRIKVNKRGQPKGIWGSLFRYAIQTKRKGRQRQVFLALKLDSAVMLGGRSELYTNWKRLREIRKIALEGNTTIVMHQLHIMGVKCRKVVKTADKALVGLRKGVLYVYQRRSLLAETAEKEFWQTVRRLERKKKDLARKRWLRLIPGSEYYSKALTKLRAWLSLE